MHPLFVVAPLSTLPGRYERERRRRRGCRGRLNGSSAMFVVEFITQHFQADTRGRGGGGEDVDGDSLARLQVKSLFACLSVFSSLSSLLLRLATKERPGRRKNQKKKEE